MKDADIIVVGAGAAGLMCAITAASRGRSVVVLEGSNKVGKKILMSGGGRCNFTNMYTDADNFLSGNPHFCKSALSRYTPWDFIALVDKHAVAWHEKALGQLFCDVSSKDVVALLLAECEAAGVHILTHADDISILHDHRFAVSCSRGSFTADSVVIASGGLSIPKMGASDFGYRIARQFGHTVLETSAGLVPFTFTGSAHDMMQRLSGVSCRAAVTANNTSFDEDILFTHRGMSGPAILQASSYWQPGQDIFVDLLPGVDAAELLLEAKLARNKATVRTLLSAHLPRALVLELQALFWADEDDMPVMALSNERLREIGMNLNNWSLRPAATEGYRTAEVTLGGVDTDGLSSQTLESKYQPGLFFCWRSRRRYRPSGRIQLPVGLGLRARSRPGRLTRRLTFFCRRASKF